MIKLSSNSQQNIKIETVALPTEQGDFKMLATTDGRGVEHAALYSTELDANPFVRIHSACISGDVFNSLRCDCGKQLQLAREIISQYGGVLIYLNQEGRGIGLVNKIKSYQLQDKGFDTVEANLHLGYSHDIRDYKIAAIICRHLKINNIKLITNNPDKKLQLEKHGIKCCELISAGAFVNKHNKDYINTKAKKLGHHFTITQE